MAKKSFLDYFILFFMFITVVLQITTLSLLSYVKIHYRKKEYNKDDLLRDRNNNSTDIDDNNNSTDIDDNTISYKDILKNIPNIYNDVNNPTTNAYDRSNNGDVKIRTVFIILGPILLLSLTLLLFINHLLIKNKIISIILSFLLLLISLYVIISNVRLDLPYWNILEETSTPSFWLFYSFGLLNEKLFEKYEVHKSHKLSLKKTDYGDFIIDIFKFEYGKIDFRKANSIEIVRLLNILMTILFSAFYFIYVLK